MLSFLKVSHVDRRLETKMKQLEPRASTRQHSSFRSSYALLMTKNDIAVAASLLQHTEELQLGRVDCFELRTATRAII